MIEWVRDMENGLDQVFERLARFAFRRRFRLRGAERQYLESKGLDAVLLHGSKSIEERLGPPIHGMTESRPRCGIIRSSSPSTGPQLAAEAAWKNGMGYPEGIS